MSDLSECLTNRTAGVFAIVMLMPLTMVDALSNALSSDSKTPPKKSVEMRKVDDLMAKYGLSDSAADPTPVLIKSGRPMLKDVAALWESMAPEKQKNKPTVSDLQKGVAADTSTWQYTVVSPTEVKIVDPSKPAQSVSAMLDDGVWRLDFGGMEMLKPATQQSSNPALAKAHEDLENAIDDDDVTKVVAIVKANPGVINDPGDFGSPPIFKVNFSGRADMVPVLAHLGANVNARQIGGKTPLMDASFWGKVDVVRALIKAGASLNLKDEHGETALTIARKNNSPDVAAVLKKAGATGP